MCLKKQVATFCLEVYSDANSSMSVILFSKAAKQVKSHKGVRRVSSCKEHAQREPASRLNRTQGSANNGVGGEHCANRCVWGLLSSCVHPASQAIHDHEKRNRFTPHRPQSPLLQHNTPAPGVCLAARSEICPFSGKAQEKSLRKA